MPSPRSNIDTWKKDLECLCCGQMFYATVMDYEMQFGVCGPCYRDRAPDRLLSEKKDLYRRVHGRHMPALRDP